MNEKLNIHHCISTLPLLGSKVLVRPFSAQDISDSYLAWLNDAKTVRFSNQRFRTHDLESARRYFNSFTGSPNAFLAIDEKKDGRHVGTMTIYVQPHHGTADVGILLGEHGKGYGRDAWCLVIDWLLTTCQARKVTAGTLASNQAMVRLMELAGMKHEATRSGQELFNGMAEDIIYFAKFHTD